MLKKNSILFYSILFYSVNIEAKNVVKDFFIKGEKIITWNGISSTSIQMYKEYCKGFSEKDNEKLKKEFNLFAYYDDTEIRYIKNKYELVRNLFSFSFYCKKQFSRAGFFVFNFNFLDNTNLRQRERIFLEKDSLIYEPGSGRIGILSFLFGIGFYWLKKNNFNISSSFNLGFIWTRDNAMQIPNYKYNRNVDKEKDGINWQYYGYLYFYFDDEGNLVTSRTTLEFLPFHYFTWMHGDILFKFEILSIQYKHFYIGCTWKRGIFDTVKVIKNQWWKCLPSTISIEIGYIFK